MTASASLPGCSTSASEHVDADVGPEGSQAEGRLSWPQLAAVQDGVLGRRQARLAGLSEDQWQWRLSSRRWQSVLPGVAVTHTGAVTARQQAWAAVVYAGPGACLSGDAALVVHGMRLAAPSVIHVAVPEGRLVRVQSLAGPDDERLRVQSRQVRALDAWRHPVRQPPVVRLPAAVLHAAAWAPSDRAAEWRVAAAVQQRLVLPRDLRTALEALPRLRRRDLLRAVLDDVQHGAHAAGELAFLRFLKRHGLPAPDRLQRPVRAGQVRYLDAWWERQRTSVELDGAHHRTAGTWEDDTLRANDVVLTERHDRILLLRFTNGQLRHDEQRVAEQLAAALR